MKGLSCDKYNAAPLPKWCPNRASLAFIAVFVLRCFAFSASLVHLSCLSLPPFRAFLLPRAPPLFLPAPHAFCPPLALSLLALAFLTTPSLFSWMPIAFSASPPLLQPKQFLRLCVMKLVQNVCVALILNHFLKIREIDVKCFT